MHCRLAAILAADLVSFSRPMTADDRGDPRSPGGVSDRLHRARDHEEPRPHRRGLAQLASVVDAVECAAPLQEGLRANYEQREPAQRNLLRFVDLLRLRTCMF